MTQVVTAHRTVGPLNLGDPAIRRELAITRRSTTSRTAACDWCSATHPTPDQTAAYWLANDLAPVLRRLAVWATTSCARRSPVCAGGCWTTTGDGPG